MPVQTAESTHPPVKIAATSSAVRPPAAAPKLVFMLVRCTTSADTALAISPLVGLPDTYMYTEPLLKPACDVGSATAEAAAARFAAWQQKQLRAVESSFFNLQHISSCSSS